MLRLRLSLPQPLSLVAAAALPPGCRVDNGPGGATVRLDLAPGDLAGLVAATAALARALPDAAIGLEGGEEAAAAGPGAEPPAGPAPAAEATAGGEDPWDLVEAGRGEEALARLRGRPLDGEGRDRVRALLHGAPAQVALACRIAAATDWRSFVTQMRGLLGHADAGVRAAAAAGIGALAGPSLAWQLQKLEADSDAGVRAAVAEALAAIAARQG